MSSKSREILNKKQIDIIFERLCHELIENHDDFDNSEDYYSVYKD